jgi:hypothetical protein
LLQEVQDEKYELLFGDGYFGKKLEDGAVVTVSYVITDGKDGNGPSNFSFSGRVIDGDGNIVIPTSSITVDTKIAASNGGDIEPIESIKYFAPRIYASQHRAVTTRDYEAVIQSIYPNTESVSVVGGEELDPPQFGNVLISIKPKNGNFVSDFDKQNILSKLKEYSISGINQKIIDLKILFVEIDSAVYYNSAQVSNINDLKTNINTVLNTFSSSNINQFGGRFKYSKLVQTIDNVDDAISSNITRVKIRRNLNALINTPTQYELCYGNEFHINEGGFNIKSTGFTISGSTDLFYFTDVPNKGTDGKLDGSGKGVLVITKDEKNVQGEYVISRTINPIGTIDYVKGEIMINTVVITSTVKENNVIEIQAIPESNDVIGLKDLYLSFDVANSKINMVRDTITSGEQTSGVGYKTTSSYLNGELKRI